MTDHRVHPPDHAGTAAAPTDGGPTGDGLADRLSGVARDLDRGRGADATLAAIVRAAVGTVPGARHASISAIRRRREVVTRAATGPLPRAVDQAQFESGQGPCLDSLFDQATVRLPDLPGEDRWPDFTLRAGELGVGSMLCVRLFVDGDDLGALNLHSEDKNAFDDESEHVALLFASHAAIAMSSAQAQDQLRRAVGTRQLIGQAQGILMERLKIAEDRAFGLLVHASQDSNRKLVDVAADLVRSGHFPAPGPRQGQRSR